MPDLVSDGYTKVSWVPTIASVAAPTVAELTAGTSLESLITPDGLKIDPSTANVDTSSVASTYDTAKAGRTGYDVAVTLKRQSGTDTVFSTTLRKNQTGYLVVRRNIVATTAWAAAQIVEVYPAECSEPQLASPAANEVQKYTVPMTVTSAPSTYATVAA